MGAVTEPRNPAPTPGRLHARRARNDLIVLAVVGIVLYGLLVRIEAFERFYAWSRTHETWQLDEVLFAIALFAVASAFYALRRWQDLRAEISRREAAETAARRLEGLLPICAACKRIRESGGGWVAVEEYVAARTEAAFTHGICPDCRQRLYPGLDASAIPAGQAGP
jgi:hypothetical protein